MKTEVSFWEGHPAADMTRDEVITWLLGSTSTMGVISALSAYWLTASMIDGMKEGQAVEIEVPDGKYLLTVTVARRRLRRIRTYHAEARA